MTADRPTWPVRTLTDDDWPAMVALDSHAFGTLVVDELMDLEHALQEPGRAIGVHDEDLLVGIATAYSLRLTVPGGTLPAAGVTWVGVLPTHRRRGVLSALMDHQLGSLHDAGREPVAVLWASEAPIYGRYGYGSASRYVSVTVTRSPAALRPDAPADPGLRLRLAPAGDWRLTAGVYDQVAARRPGMLARDERWWQRAVRDVPALREGSSELRCIVAEDGSGVRGYARYATKQSFGSEFGRGVVNVREVVAADPAALATLCRYLFDLDLMGSTEIWNTPVDSPLLLWLADPRRGAEVRSNDALYVRLVDLGAALAGRTYVTDVDVVLDVADARCPWNAGRWRLTGGPGGATCTRTDDPADLALDVRELGAAYLGGTSLEDLAAAGWVTGSDEAVRSAGAAFRHSPAPWVPVVF